MSSALSRPKGFGARARAAAGSRDDPGTEFVGSAIAKYDVDELDDIGGVRRQKEKFVEVRRPDGTVAKSRGERTFYGAFTGGFTAGYWNTVGSKEGWAPASFSSSRSSRRLAAPQRTEDLMDAEDLQEHRASHKTITAREEYLLRDKPSGRDAGAHNDAFPGGLPKALEDELFSNTAGRSAITLGAHLLEAGSSGGKASLVLEDAKPSEPQQQQTKKRRYGCALPPGRGESAVAAIAAPSASGSSGAALATLKFVKLDAQPGLTDDPSSKAVRQFEAELERLWLSKRDLHGIGYGSRLTAGQLGQQVPSGRRLYLSAAKRTRGDKRALYGDFGTGVFDMEDYDAWEDVYDNSEKHDFHDHALRDNEIEEEAQLARLEDVRGSRAPLSAAAAVDGFVEAREPDGADEKQYREWEAPPVPRGYRGYRRMHGDALDEAKAGSAEHRALLEFLETHGERRLMDPAHRAELLGERSRASTGSSGSNTVPQAAPSSDPHRQQQPHQATAAAAAGESHEAVLSRSSQPLWQGVSEEHKNVLLGSLGRSFVVGNNQDMDGLYARHEPFKCDPAKQRRYVLYCLALEGKASASEALGAAAQLSEQQRELELAEFGRTYRTFRIENPSVELQSALDTGRDNAAASQEPVFRRTVHSWAPAKLLCKRWGVPEPKLDPATVAAEQQQRNYSEQVRRGMEKANVANPRVSKFSWTPPAQLLGDAGAGQPTGVAAADAATASTAEAGTVVNGELVRPPKSLFASIFGDDDD